MTSTISTQQVWQWITAYRDEIDRRVDELNKLDAAVGDGDFGASMQRGLDAVVADSTLSDQEFIGELLKKVGMTLVSAMGGTSGPLVGTFFLKMGISLGEITEADLESWARAVRAGVEGVMTLGQAKPGEKTMIDGMMPALEAMEAASEAPFHHALQRAADAAGVGAQATREMAATKGRASYVGGAGVGALDPGAVGASILFETMGRSTKD